MKKKIVVLIPSLNPEKELITYVKDLIKRDQSIDVIVVNDGSRSDKAKIFDEVDKIKNCVVLTHAINLGKGRALKTGFNYYLNHYTEDTSGGIVTADSDGQHAINDVVAIGKELNYPKNKNALILGTRDFNLEQVPFKSRNGNKITTNVFRSLYGKKINDTQTGLRGINYEFVKTCLSLEGERFEYEINMLISAVREKVALKEHIIETIYFNNNAETHFNPWKDSIRIYKVMFKYFFKFMLVSLSSAILDLLIFTIAYFFYNKVADTTLSILLSTVTARIISSFYNYMVNRNVVFNNSKGKETFFKYYFLCVIQMFLSFFLVDKIFLWLQASEGFLTVIKIVVDVILFIISFQIQQRWVFAKKKEVK